MTLDPVKQKAAGLCHVCNNPAADGRTYCAVHLERMKQWMKKRNAERRAKGLCLWCGEPAVPGLVNCEKHRRIHNEKSKRRKRYGLTNEQRLALLAKQGGVCAICGGSDPGPRDWHTDHDHATGAVRGILCHHCNMGLGAFRDSIQKLWKAIEYIHRNVGTRGGTALVA